MALLQAALALVILAVCSFAPGFFFVRRTRWSALEKLCGSVALSLILLWLAAWGIYVSGAPWQIAPVVTIVSLGMGAAAWRDAAALLRAARVRRTLAGFAFLLLWTLV